MMEHLKRSEAELFGIILDFEIKICLLTKCPNRKDFETRIEDKSGIDQRKTDA